MKPADVVLWERFIEKFPEAYDYVFYDYHVGSGPDFDTTVNPETGGDDRDLYRYKIDVVGMKDEKVDLIEIKPRAGPSCCGQICFYRCLWGRDIVTYPEPRAVIITDILRPDMKYVCSDLEIKIVLV